MAGSVPTELGVKPINQLIRQYAVPGIIAMTASSLYNMVDRIYIGHIPDVGSLAISGLAVTFPLMNISTAFGTLVGVGAATMISVLLGQKNYAVANKVLSNEVTLNILTGIIFTTVTLLWMDPILRFFGASDATLPYARSYMTIVALGNAVTHLYFGLNSVIRSSGNPKTAMGLTLFTVTSNAILDPLFIFGFKMGILGAAVATVLCQMMALGYTMWFFLDQDKFLHLPRQGLPRHRHGPVPDEPRQLHRRPVHQPAARQVGRRPGTRRLRHREQHQLPVRDDHHGFQPGHAAYRGL